MNGAKWRRLGSAVVLMGLMASTNNKAADGTNYQLSPSLYQNQNQQQYVYVNNTLIDCYESGNNRITGAPTLGAGRYGARVGGSDHTDFLKVRATAGGAGTLVQVEVRSGSVNLHYYDPTQSYLDGGTNRFWIALAPGATVYFQVSSTRASSTSYSISVSKKKLVDVYEENDSFSNAKVYKFGRAFLGNVINSSGRHVGISDYFKFYLSYPRNLQITVYNAGLASSERVELSLYDPYGAHETSATGDNDRCRLTCYLRNNDYTYPPFPRGNWRIEVRTPTATAGSPVAYGNGTPPECYTDSTGYSLRIRMLP